MQEGVIGGESPIQPEAQYLPIDIAQCFPVGDGGNIVSNRPPELSIGANMQIVSTMVLVLQLIPAHEDQFTGEVNRAVDDREPGKLRMFIGGGVGDVDVAVGGVVWIHGEAEQALLVRAISRDGTQRRRQN